jgi:hypothetical protein
MLLEISVVLQQLCDQNSDLRAKCPTKKSWRSQLRQPRAVSYLAVYLGGSSCASTQLSG